MKALRFALHSALGLLIGTAAAAQPPTLPAAAGTVQGFVPAGWTVVQRHAADFNRDRRTDALLLLQPAAEGGARSPERVLAVLLRQGRGWVLQSANARLIPQLELATQQDPLADGEIVVRPGGFSLTLGLAASAGSYQAATLVYRFRFDGGCMRLIGHDRLEVHRATLDTQDLRINFLTGAVQRSQGNAQRDDQTVQRERLAANPRRCLQDLDSALSFQPLAAAAALPPAQRAPAAPPPSR